MFFSNHFADDIIFIMKTSNAKVVELKKLLPGYNWKKEAKEFFGMKKKMHKKSVLSLSFLKKTIKAMLETDTYHLFMK